MAWQINFILHEKRPIYFFENFDYVNCPLLYDDGTARRDIQKLQVRRYRIPKAYCISSTFVLPAPLKRNRVVHIEWQVGSEWYGSSLA